MEIKVLAAIPCLYNAHICSDAINSALNKRNVDLLIADNGAEQEVKNIIEKFKEYANVTVIHESVNIFVNPIWNKFMEYFLNTPKYTHICILNSDIILHHDWMNALNEAMKVFKPDQIFLPIQLQDKTKLQERTDYSKVRYNEIDGGYPGIFILLNKEQCSFVHPIPEQIKVWFGENWIWEILKAHGNRMLILEELKCWHEGSQTIKRVDGIHEIIEQDKISWENEVKPILEEKIKKLKQKL
jgi:hypothetical protein